MMKQLIKTHAIDVENKIRSLPRLLNLGDFYSGAGTFFMVVEAVVKAFQVVAPDPADDLEVLYEMMRHGFCAHGMMIDVMMMIKILDFRF